MEEPQNVNVEIVRLGADGAIEVLRHEPEHVVIIVRTLLAMKNENEQLRALLDQSLKDTERLEWLIQSGLISGRERIDTSMTESKQDSENS